MESFAYTHFSLRRQGKMALCQLSRPFQTLGKTESEVHRTITTTELFPNAHEAKKDHDNDQAESWRQGS